MLEAIKSCSQKRKYENTKKRASSLHLYQQMNSSFVVIVEGVY